MKIIKFIFLRVGIGTDIVDQSDATWMLAYPSFSEFGRHVRFLMSIHPMRVRLELI